MSLVDLRAKNCSPLMVQDLFYTVLDCYRPAYDPTARQALASLAQTCRAFSEPALDRLWEKLHSLEPLIRCYAGAGGVANTVCSSSHSIISCLTLTAPDPSNPLPIRRHRPILVSRQGTLRLWGGFLALSAMHKHATRLPFAQLDGPAVGPFLSHSHHLHPAATRSNTCFPQCDLFRSRRVDNPVVLRELAPLMSAFEVYRVQLFIRVKGFDGHPNAFQGDMSSESP